MTARVQGSWSTIAKKRGKPDVRGAIRVSSEHPLGNVGYFSDRTLE